MTETPDPWVRGIDYRKPTGIQMPVVINDRRLIFRERDNDDRYVNQPSVRDIFGEMTVAALRQYPVILPVPLACTASIPGPKGRKDITVQITHLDLNLPLDQLPSDQDRSSNKDRPVLGTCYVRAEWESESGQMAAWLQASLLCEDELGSNGRPVVRWACSPRVVLLEHLEREMERVLESAREDPRTDLLGLLARLEKDASRNLRS